jgi:outer membrane protein OmpA-like peptidoglycan-associated protein
MMAGLMMVFLFIAVVFMQQIKEKEGTATAIVDDYKATSSELNSALHREFDEDLAKWGAEITHNNFVRFNEPSTLFDGGEWVIKNRFAVILEDFYPRYLSILTSKQFVNDIAELRIEGHTSSRMAKPTPLNLKYMYNADLSQKRAFSVLNFVFNLETVAGHREWMVSVLRANGLAFSKTINNPTTNKEDFAKSRRVEFSVTTNMEDRLLEAL